MELILFSALGVVLIMLIVLTYYLRNNQLMKQQELDDSMLENEESIKEKIENSQTYVYAGIVLTIITLLILLYLLVKGTPREAHLMEWLNIIVRWMHITLSLIHI